MNDLSKGGVDAINVDIHKVPGSASYSLSATFIMSTKWQNLPDADIILRASEGKEFHAHKVVLSLASPVFRDMFSVPQPPPAKSSKLPIVDVHDPPEALEIFLQIIYPTRNPVIHDVDILASVLHLADKYDAKDTLDVHKDYLPSTYSDLSPIQMYAILCACGREGEAGVVARRIPFASLKTLDSSPLLQFITTTQYQRLVSFMATRDQKMREQVLQYNRDIMKGNRFQCNDETHSLYSSTIVATVQAAFEADPCVRVGAALSSVLSAPCTFTKCRDGCRYNIDGIRKYVKSILGGLRPMVENLPWELPESDSDSDGV